MKHSKNIVEYHKISWNTHKTFQAQIPAKIGAAIAVLGVTFPTISAIAELVKLCSCVTELPILYNEKLESETAWKKWPFPRIIYKISRQQKVAVNTIWDRKHLLIFESTHWSSQMVY